MDLQQFQQLYSFLFESFGGIAVLVGGGLILSLILAFVMEKKTRRVYKNHEKNPDDWSFFGDDEDEEKPEGEQKDE